MADDQYVWLAWASIGTAPFGLTEPVFVPEYWSPPSLFDPAQREVGAVGVSCG